MAKKSKNSKLLVHYTRTMTPENLSRAANYVGGYVLRGLGALGKIFTAPLTGGPMGTNTVPLYPRTVLLANAERKLRETQEELIGKVMTWVSPLNYGAALATGNGLNAKKGEEEVASWSPAWQAVGRLGELYVGPKGVKGVKSAPRVVVNTAAKAGVKPAKAAVVAREINKGIKQNTRNGKIEVTEDYFNSPDKWYRVSERPEKIGIELNGKNVTTSDDPGINGTINGWRESMLSLTGRIIPGKGIDEGYFIFLPRKISLSKHGAAHGNTSQAAKGLIWLGTFAFSDKFPIGVIEGLAPVKIFRGMNNLGKDSRTNFVLLNWEDVPLGARVGFHTGEMPMSNLGWFLKTKNGTYTYEPIIPEKRITYLPILLLEPSTSLAFFERKPSITIQISPEQGYPFGNKLPVTMKQVLNFIDNDIIPRLKKQGHLIDSYTPNIRVADFKNDLMDLKMQHENGGAWFEKASNTTTLRGPLEDQDFGLVIHETGGHGIRHNLQSDYRPVNRELINKYLENPQDPTILEPLLKGHFGHEAINNIETNILNDSYPEIDEYFQLFINPLSGLAIDPKVLAKRIQGEKIAVNTQFRAKLSENGKLTGTALDKKIKETPEGVILRMKIELGYTSNGILKNISKITGISTDALNFYSPLMLLQLVNKFPELKTMADKVKYSMKHVAGYIAPTVGGYTLYNLLNNLNNQLLEYRKQGGKMNILELFKHGGQIRKMQTAAGGPIRWARKKENLEGIFNSLSKPSIQLRRQEQANRLNRSNSVGNYAYQIGKALGFKMSEDSANLATINSASKEALKDTRDYYNSLEYEQRLKDAGVPLYNRDSLLDKLQNISIYSLSDKSIPEFKTNSGGNFRAATATKPFKGNVTGKRFGPGVYYNRSTMKDGNGENVYGTFIHEFSHWADPGLFPEAIEYNRSLTEGNLNSKASPYFRSDTEIRARAMDGIVTYEKNKDKYRDLDDFLDKEKDVKGLRELRNTFKDEKSFRNYMHNFVKNDNTKFDPNIVYYAKNGIHIKKENRGKFTDYCGGKVTSECIAKGKRSSSATIRKRATFADNARHFKHRSGGVLYIFLEGGKTSWWNKAINFVNNSGLGETALNALSTYTLNKLIGASSDVAKALVDKDKASRILLANLAAELEARNILLNNINPENPNAMSGDIVKNFIKNKLLNLKMALINLESNLEKAEIDWQTLLLKNLNTTNMLSGIGNILYLELGHVGLYMGNKLLTNVNNT